MTCVPEYGLLQMILRPNAFSSSAMTSGGKPSGYVGIGRSETIPAISQWPVVVSLPRESSRRRAKAPIGWASGVPQPTPSILKRPIFFIFGVSYSFEATMERSVLQSPSPNSFASGSAPMPKLSRTMMNARLNACMSVIPFYNIS